MEPPRSVSGNDNSTTDDRIGARFIGVALIAMAGIALILPAQFSICLLVPALILTAVAIRLLDQRLRLIFLFLITLNLISIAVMAHISRALPLPVRSQGDLARYALGLGLLAVPDIGQVEASVYERRMLVWKDGAGPFSLPDLDYTEIDPFTGQPYLLAGDQKYSVGPDLIDQNGESLYDPTNGTFSPGDLLFRIPP